MRLADGCQYEQNVLKQPSKQSPRYVQNHD